MLDWDLADLSTFVAVAETGSFTRAAYRLGLTPSALSKRIKQLEGKLQVDLLKRSSRSVSLTEAGTRLVEHASRALGELEAAQGVVGGLAVEPVGTLRVSAPASFAQAVLGPLIAKFLRRYPRINIVLALCEIEPADAHAKSDVVIRTTSGPPPGSVARRIARFDWKLVASARHLAEAGAIESPRDLAARRMVTPGEAWLHARFRHRRTRAAMEVELLSFLAVDSVDGALAAIRQHAGIGLAPGYLVEPLLAGGELRQVLPDWTLVHAPPGVVYATWRRSRLPAPKVDAFVAFIAAELPRA